MSTPLRALPEPGGNPNDVIRRVVKALLGAYDMTHDQFAKEVDMIPRTFARRLADSGPGRNFTADDVGRIAAFVSRSQGTTVSISDIYGGKVDVSQPRRASSGPFSPSVNFGWSKRLLSGSPGTVSLKRVA